VCGGVWRTHCGARTQAHAERIAQDERSSVLFVHQHRPPMSLCTLGVTCQVAVCRTGSACHGQHSTRAHALHGMCDTRTCMHTPPRCHTRAHCWQPVWPRTHSELEQAQPALLPLPVAEGPTSRTAVTVAVTHAPGPASLAVPCTTRATGTQCQLRRRPTVTLSLRLSHKVPGGIMMVHTAAKRGCSSRCCHSHV